MDNSDKLIKGVIYSVVALIAIGLIGGLAVFGVLWLIFK